MIKINEKFSLEKDAYGWKLHEFRNGKDKDGNQKVKSSVTFHANINQVCNRLVDRTLGECETILEFERAILNAENIVTAQVTDLVENDG